jgi:hypothetical protein
MLLPRPGQQLGLWRLLLQLLLLLLLGMLGLLRCSRLERLLCMRLLRRARCCTAGALCGLLQRSLLLAACLLTLLLLRRRPRLLRGLLCLRRSCPLHTPQQDAQAHRTLNMCHK